MRVAVCLGNFLLCVSCLFTTFYRLVQGVCFSEPDQALCIFCSFDHYNSQGLFSQRNRTINESACLPKNSSFILSRKILVGNFSEHDYCKHSGSEQLPDCQKISTFKNTFDGYYPDMFTAFYGENLLMQRFLKSSLQITIFGKTMFAADSLNEKIDFFRRLLINISIAALECSVGEFLGICSIYSASKPLIFFRRQFMPTIYIAGRFLIENADFSYNASGEAALIQAIFHMEPVLDSKENFTPELTLRNCNFFASTEEIWDINIIRMHPGGRLRLESAVLRDLILGESLVVVIKDKEETGFNSSLLLDGEKEVNSEVELKSFSIRNLRCSDRFTALFSLNGLVGDILIQNFEFLNVTCPYHCSLFFISRIKAVEAPPMLKNIMLSSCVVSSILQAELSDIYIWNMTAFQVLFPDSSVLMFGLSESVVLSGLGLFSCNLNFQKGKRNESSPFIYAFSVKALSLQNSKFVNSSSIDLETKASEVGVSNCLFLNVNFSEAVIKGSIYGTLVQNCIFTNVSGDGVIFNQIQGDLNLYSIKMSLITALVIINFDNIINNIIASSLFMFIQNPQYFWTRNLQVRNQMLINNSFSYCFFLRIQSLYRAFDVAPRVLHKECSFSNTMIGYGFDYCCLDLTVINCKFSSMELVVSALYSLEIDGNFYFENNTFLNVGWKSYNNLTMGGQIGLWYPISFLLTNCSFLMTKPLSLRSGFITSRDMDRTIIIRNSMFIVQSPSLFCPVKGILFFSIREVLIHNCTFVNLTCDLLQGIQFFHINGVISLFGSASFFENFPTNSTLQLRFIVVVNALARNGAGLTVVSYKEVLVENCSFYYGKAKDGYGGLIAIVAVQIVKIQTSCLRDGFSDSGGLIYLKNVNFADVLRSSFQNSKASESGGCVSLQGNIYTILRNDNFSSCFSEGVGGFLFLSQGALALRNVICTSTHSNADGGAVYMENFVNVHIDDSFFGNFSAGLRGGMLIGEVKNISMQNLTIEQGMSIKEGTLMLLESFSFIKISDCVFRHARCAGACKGGLMIFTTFFEESELFIRNIDLFNLSSEGTLLLVLCDASFLISKISISQWKGKKALTFTGLKGMTGLVDNLSIANSLSLGTDFIEFTKVLMRIERVSLENISFEQNLLKVSLSALAVKDITIQGIKAHSAEVPIASVIAVQESLLQLSLLHFIVKQSSLLPITKSSLFIVSDSAIYLIDLVCEMNRLKFLTAYDSDFVLRGSLIYSSSIDWEGSRFYITSEGVNSLNISSCKFSFPVSYLFEIMKIERVFVEDSIFNCTETLFFCQAFWATEVKSFTLKSSVFFNLQAKSGAALELRADGACAVFVDNSSFSNCISTKGGAIFLSCLPKLAIIGSSFINNQAVYMLRSALSNEGIGGSIFAACSNPAEGCSASVASSIFLNNFASNYAATIFSNFAIEIAESNNFENNTDINGLTTDYFSYPLKYKIEQEGKLSSEIRLTSGVAGDVTILLTDYFENLLRLVAWRNLLKTLTNILLGSFDSKSSARIQLKKNVNSVSLQNGISFCKGGALRFPNLLIKSLSGKNLTLSLQLEFFHDPLAFPKRVEFEVPVAIRQCLLGEIVERDLTCKRCQKGTYSFEDPSSAKECKKCPDNFDCLGGDVLFPKPGYWRESIYSTLAVRCLMEAACLGSLKENMTDTDKQHGACAEGHFGNLCFECAKGYGKFESRSLCESCDKERPLLVLKVIILAACIILFVLLNGYIMSRDLKPKGESSNFILFKMIFTHLQSITIIVFMEDISALPSMNEFLRIISYISFIKDDIVSLDCFFSDKQNSYLYKTILVVVLPFILGTVVMAFWLTFALLFKIYSVRAQTSSGAASPNSLQSYKQKEIILKRIIISFAIAAYSFYPLIIQSAFTLPNCLSMRKGAADMQYLYASPNVRCWTDLHLKFIYFLFLPAILLWGCIFPLSLKYILMMSRGVKKLHDSGSSRLSLDKTFRAPKKKSSRIFNILEYKIFRFFYEDYKYEFYYWEAVIFLKKFFLTALSSIRNIIGQDTKFILIILVLVIYEKIIMKRRPFIFEICNTYEIISTSVIVVTSLLIIIINFEQNFNVLIFLGFLTFLLNVAFISLLLLSSLTNFLKRFVFLRRLIPSLRRYTQARKKQTKPMAFFLKETPYQNS